MEVRATCCLCAQAVFETDQLMCDIVSPSIWTLFPFWTVPWWRVLSWQQCFAAATTAAMLSVLMPPASKPSAVRASCRCVPRGWCWQRLYAAAIISSLLQGLQPQAGGGIGCMPLCIRCRTAPVSALMITAQTDAKQNLCDCACWHTRKLMTLRSCT